MISRLFHDRELARQGRGAAPGNCKMTSGRGGQPTNMAMKYSGKRLNDCTKQPTCRPTRSGSAQG
jgi:hypothetical protein